MGWAYISHMLYISNDYISEFHPSSVKTARQSDIFKPWIHYTPGQQSSALLYITYSCGDKFKMDLPDIFYTT